jgi:beta-xylosidase
MAVILKRGWCATAGLALVVGIVGMVGMVGLASPVRAAVSRAPSYPGDFPDPFVVTAGSTYWAYSTGSGGRNLQVMSSGDLHAWTTPADPLPVLPGWAQAGFTWAPGVLERGVFFVMYYTVRQASSGRQCLSVATSLRPGGPFDDRSSGPLVCQLNHGGSIDPNPFVAPNGTAYLLWKSDDNAIGQATNLWAAPLSLSGLTLAAAPSLMLTEKPRSWQVPVVEGPAMVANGRRYYLFYGANNWDSANAAIGYATCASPLGPCTDASTSSPWLASRGTAVGPSGPAIFIDSTGKTRLAYHAWTGAVGYNNGGVRSLWIDHLTFASGRPVLG